MEEARESKQPPHTSVFIKPNVLIQKYNVNINLLYVMYCKLYISLIAMFNRLHSVVKLCGDEVIYLGQ